MRGNIKQEIVVTVICIISVLIILCMSEAYPYTPDTRYDVDYGTDTETSIDVFPLVDVDIEVKPEVEYYRFKNFLFKIDPPDENGIRKVTVE